MNKQKLNNLVEMYFSNPSDENFTSIYLPLKQKWTSNIEVVAESVKTDPNTILALNEDVLIKCLQDWNRKGDFLHYLNASINRSRASLFRKNKRRYEMEIYEDYDESDAPTFEFADEFQLEDYVINKTEADQRQLIDSLTKNIDAETTAIVKAFSQYKSITALAKALGLHHMTVIRTLEKLSSNFDYKQFGDYRDYLVVTH